MKLRDYTEINRRSWDETAEIHENAYVKQLRDRIRAPDFTTFDTIEEQLFERIGLTDKLSDIISGCLKHKLSISHFQEYDHDISIVSAGDIQRLSEMNYAEGYYDDV